MTSFSRLITRFALLTALAAALMTQSVMLAGAQRTQMPGRLLGNTYVGSGGLFEVNTDDTNFVNLTPNTYSGALNRADSQPSVSGDGKLIAFASSRNSSNGQTHIWIMNGDGSNLHALTVDATAQTGSGSALSPTPVFDRYPSISPDGTKIVFVSNRTTAVANFGGGSPYTYDSRDLYVINTDGTGLHAVTSPEPNNYGGGPFGSEVYSAVWGPDSKHLVFKGARLTPTAQTSFNHGIFFINADGSGESVFSILNSTGEWGSVDWSPNGRYLAAPYGGEAQGAVPFRLYIWDLIGSNNQTLFYNATSIAPSANLEGFGIGTFRFSPDSTRIVFPTTPDYITDHPAMTNLDGSGLHVMNLGVGRGTWLWWQGGPAVPKPAKLTLQYNLPPDVLLLYSGQPGVAVLPTLYDTNGNVIVHAVADWTPSDGRFFNVAVNGVATPISTAQYGALSLTADNGGITSNTLGVMIDLPKLGTQLTNVSKYGDGTIRIDLNLTNSGKGTAANFVITSVSLDGVAAKPNLFGSLPPYPVGDLLPGGSAYQNYLFPPSSKPSGASVLLKLKGTYYWHGTFTATARVALP